VTQLSGEELLIGSGAAIAMPGAALQAAVLFNERTDAVA
jgi:hypothetical protein